MTTRPSGVGKAGKKKAMITTRNCAGDGAAGITTEAVRDQPLPVEQNLRRRVRRVPLQHAPDRFALARRSHHVAGRRYGFGFRRGLVAATERNTAAASAKIVQPVPVATGDMPDNFCRSS